MMKKLLCRRGETLTEALVSILVIALSAALLATMITVAATINRSASNAMGSYYAQITAAEGGNALTTPTLVTLTGTSVSGTVDVTYYGRDTDSLAAYVRP